MKTIDLPKFLLNKFPGISLFILAVRICLFVECVILFREWNNLFSAEYGFFNAQMAKVYLNSSPVYDWGLSGNLLLGFLAVFTFLSFFQNLIFISFFVISAIQLLIIKQLSYFSSSSFELLFYLTTIISLSAVAKNPTKIIEPVKLQERTLPVLLILHMFIYSFQFYWAIKAHGLGLNFSSNLSINRELFRDEFLYSLFNNTINSTYLGPSLFTLWFLMIFAPLIVNNSIRRLLVIFGSVLILFFIIFLNVSFLTIAFLVALIPVYQRHLKISVWPPPNLGTKLSLIVILAGLFVTSNPDKKFLSANRYFFPGHSWQVFSISPKEHTRWFLSYTDKLNNETTLPYSINSSGVKITDKNFLYLSNLILAKSEMALVVKNLIFRFCSLNEPTNAVNGVKLYRETFFINKSARKNIMAAQFSCCPQTEEQAQICE